MLSLASLEVIEKTKELLVSQIGGKKVDVGVGLLRETDINKITKPLCLIALVLTEFVPETAAGKIVRETDTIEIYAVAKTHADKNSLLENIANTVLNASPFSLTSGQHQGLYLVSIDWLLEEGLPFYVGRLVLKSVTILP